MHLNLFQSLELAVAFHPYQREAIKTLIQKHAAGERQLHLVAPPGSGKTLMGLELARRLGQKTVILSPTSLIQAQWVNKFQALSVDLEATDDLALERVIVDTLIANDPPILSLTYQAFSVKGREESLLHPQVEQLFADLAERDYRTLLLDECHHLMAHWAAAIQHFLKQVPDAVVVGLTATPPVDRREQEIGVYLSLVGEVDYEVPTPAVIKEGHLAPYQDLVYLVRPSEAETAFVTGAHTALHALLKELEDTPKTGLPLLSFWAEEWLLYPQDAAGQSLDKRELLFKAPDLTIALVRYLYSQGIYPEGLPWSPEMEEALRLEDLVEMLGAFGHQVLKSEAPDLWARVSQSLEELGYRYLQGRFRPRQGEIDRVLALSSAKLRAVEQILSSEFRQMGNHMRALVLTDFERTSIPGRKANASILNPEAGGALAVMRFLSALPDLRALNPVMVTGKTLLCSPALLPVLLDEAERLFSEKGLNAVLTCETHGSGAEEFVQLHGTGSDWRSALYLTFVTDLLERGLTHCLIGTRGLMGEGWDCRSLNTLIDLTVVTSFVSVNQVRGRSLRLDPEQPLKVANNWDVVALLPECEGGFRDLMRFYAKHTRFYGLSEDGLLEKGPGHVHSRFTRRDPAELLLEMEEINLEMLARSALRTQAWERWGVGKAYKCRDLTGLQLRLKAPSLDNLPALPARRQTKQRSISAPPLSLNQLPLDNLKRAKVLQLKLKSAKTQQSLARSVEAGVGLALLMGFGLTLWPLCLGLVLLTEGWLFWLNLGLSKQGKLAESSPETAILERLGQVLAESLKQAEYLTVGAEALRLSSRSDGSLRLWLDSPLATETVLFSQALSEILAPLQEQRYLLEIDLPDFQLLQRLGQTPQLRQRSLGQVVLPLPRLLARSREKAQIFADVFAEKIGSAHLVYTKQGVGREQLQSYLHRRVLPVQVQSMTVWD